MKNQVKLSLHVSPEFNALIEAMAKKMHTTKSEALKRAVVLMDVAVKEKEKGNHLGVLNSEEKVLKEIVGF